MQGPAERAGQPLPLRVEVPAPPARGGPDLVRRLFEPLGWTVTAEPVALAAEFPRRWSLTREATERLELVRLAEADDSEVERIDNAVEAETETEERLAPLAVQCHRLLDGGVSRGAPPAPGGPGHSEEERAEAVRETAKRWSEIERLVAKAGEAYDELVRVMRATAIFEPVVTRVTRGTNRELPR